MLHLPAWLVSLTASLLLAADDSRSPPSAAATPPRAALPVAASAPVAEAAPPSVLHLPEKVNGWSVAETSNFCIHHTQSQAFVELVAAVAEQTRSSMQRRWFGAVQSPWEPRCDIYLHATADDYWRTTGVPGRSRGYSHFMFDRGRVSSRTIEVRADDPTMLTAVLPHEVTHVVLAGHFGDQPVPRWADEGIAMLAEPPASLQRRLRKVGTSADGVYPLTALVSMDYPSSRYQELFYAESASVVQFLVSLKGTLVFTEFLQEALKSGYEEALRRHYGIHDLSTFEAQWSSQVQRTTVLKPNR